MDRPVEPPAATEQPQASAALMVRPSMALARRVGRSVQRWMPHLTRVRSGLRQWRDQWLRHPLADELERSRRDNEQLQQLLAELPEIFERKYQQRLEPLLEHQYRLLEDNALLMDQLRLLQGSASPEMLQLASVESRAPAPVPAAASLDLTPPAMATDPFAAIPPPPEGQPLPAAAEEESVTLEGNAPLADLPTLLHSPPWGALGPSLIEVRQPPAAPQPEPQAQPEAAPAMPAGPAAQPSFEELVSLASQQVQAGAIAKEPAAAPLPFAAQEPEALIEPEPVRMVQAPPPLDQSPWLAVEAPEAAVAPVAIATDSPSVIRSTASSPTPWQAEPPSIPQNVPEITTEAAPAASTSPEALEPPEDLDPLEQARARKLQAWRRSRQQHRD